MKNVMITLDEETAKWARVHAAERNVSLSRFVGERPLAPPGVNAAGDPEDDEEEEEEEKKKGEEDDEEDENDGEEDEVPWQATNPKLNPGAYATVSKRRAIFCCWLQ